MKINNCIFEGNGPVKLVVIPGLSLTKVTDNVGVIEGLLRSFGPGYTSYLFDRPDEVPLHCTIAWLAEELASRMASMGISDACIIGVSQGGMIAQHIALHHPELVRALVLGATLCKKNDIFVSVVSSWRDMVRDGRYSEMMMSCFRNLFTDGFVEKNKNELEMIAASSRPFGRQWFVSLAEACLDGWDPEDIGGIACPVYVMGSEGDPVVTPQASIEISRILGCGIYMYQGYKHAIYDESPDFYRRALEFFNNLPGKR